jgi:hypothetical protein
VKGVYFYLYIFIDIYSRKVVRCQMYRDENSDLVADITRYICAQKNAARSGNSALRVWQPNEERDDARQLAGTWRDALV